VHTLESGGGLACTDTFLPQTFMNKIKLRACDKRVEELEYKNGGSKLIYSEGDSSRRGGKA